jgi:hypothetical protein
MLFSKKILSLCLLASVACGGSDGAAGADTTSSDAADARAPTAGGDGASARSAGDAGTGEVPIPDFGFVASEPIEEDGSDAGVGVTPALVERLDEVRGALPLLAQAKLSLSIMVQAHKLDDPRAMEELFAVVEDAVARGIEVRPIPVLSADDGYFPNATNHVRFSEVARELARQWKARGLSPTTLLVDMEPPRELTEALSSLDLSKALPLEHIDRTRYQAGVAAFTALVDALHAEGFRVSMSTQASLLADYRDSDDDLRQYFNVVIEGPAWDELEFQLYRSAFASQAPGLTPHFVYAFASAARARFAVERVGVALGVTHPGPVFPDTPTLGSVSELQKDVAAARAAGIPRERISVYNLKGILLGPPHCDEVLACGASDHRYSDNEPAAWLTPSVNRAPPAASDVTEMLWRQLDLMDGLLDLAPAANAPE